jgi:glyoxylase-like metal-dependent hydrolase (beta-lactamase superfamily II)
MKRPDLRPLSIIVSLIIGLVLTGSASAQWNFEGEPSLVEVTPNVFRTQSSPGAVNTSVIVTDEGLVVVDATCRSQANPTWLKGELDRRFDVPVKYVILSHDHEDHICGLQVFDDTATTISHANAREHILREGRRTSIPDVIFEDRLDFFLGGKQFILYYFGPTHSDNLIQIHIPDERVLIAPDISRAGRSIVVPDYRDADVNNMIDTLTELSKLEDVDIVIPGHRGVATQENFLWFREYLTALRDRVLDEMIAGATIEQILERVTMEDYSHYANYDNWLRSNVISMWDNMYRYREPNQTSQDAGAYQSNYPIGFPIGGYASGSSEDE